MASPFSKEAKRADKIRRTLFIILSAVIFVMAVIVIFLPENDFKHHEGTTNVVDSDTISNNNPASSLGYPKAPYNLSTDEGDDEDKADNDEDYDPYDDPDWDESTPGESRPEYFIRGNIPDPELYPEDVVKEWVKEHGTEDEIRDVEEGRY